MRNNTRKGIQSARSIGKGVAIIKQTGEGGMRKVMAPHAHQYAVPVTTSNGKVVYRTPNGVNFTSTPLDRPKPRTS